jgi:hypothetical protein
VLYLCGIGQVFKAHNFEYVIYADDIVLLTSSKVDKIDDAILKLTACILDTGEWLRQQGLVLNPTKTECVLFGSPSLTGKARTLSLSLGGNSIPFSKNVKYLGVLLDDTLTMKPHINSVCKGAFGYLRIIARQKMSMNVAALKTLLHSLVLSRIEYSSSTLCGFNDLTLSSLQTVSNAALRLVARLKKYDHLGEARQKFMWLSVPQRHLLRLACIVYVAFRDGRPAYLANLLTTTCHAYATRASQDASLLDVPRTSANYSDLCFSVMGPIVWNSIPKDIRDSPSLMSFRRKFCDYLVKQQVV